MLARMRQNAAAMLQMSKQMTASYSSAAEARPLTWVFLGPPVSYYNHIV